MLSLSLHGGGGGHHHGGGGHHHGGHHGGGHYRHRGGGGFSPWYGGYYPNQVYVTPPSCPFIRAPVLGSDGKIYDNECYCRAAGAMVVRYLKPGDVVDQPGLTGALGLPVSWLTLGAIAAGVGVVAYLRRGKRSANLRGANTIKCDRDGNPLNYNLSLTAWKYAKRYCKPGYSRAAAYRESKAIELAALAKRKTLRGHDQQTDFGTIIWIGPKRKDGKIPVTYVFRSSGARLNKLLTTEKVDAEIVRAAQDPTIEIRRKR